MKLPKNFEDIDGMGGPERSRSQSALPWHPLAKVIKQGPAGVEGGTMIQSPTKPSNFVVTEVRRSSSGIPPTWVGYHSKVNGPWINPNIGWGRTNKGPYGPWKPVPAPWRRFDGGAVKKNWVPLVVLGMSLAVGIGISEWASKKYIK